MSETEAKETANGLVETPNEYVENGKNKLVACCKFCGSKILDKQVGQYIVLEKELPEMHLAVNAEAIKNDQKKEYYLVKDMFFFENIGFSHQVDNYKYLSCADCDTGPLGWFDASTKESFLAFSRIAQPNV